MDDVGAFTPSPFLPLFSFPPETPLHGVRGREGFYNALRRENDQESGADERPGTVRGAFIRESKEAKALPLPVLIRPDGHEVQGAAIDCQHYGLGSGLTEVTLSL